MTKKACIFLATKKTNSLLETLCGRFAAWRSSDRSHREGEDAEARRRKKHDGREKGFGRVLCGSGEGKMGSSRRLKL